MTARVTTFDDAARLGPVEGWGSVHLVGIGGAGMSAIARLLLARGLSVSGTDARGGPVLEALARAGARVEVGHRAEALGGARVVVVSSAVRDSNPEVAAARLRGLPVLHRSAALAALMDGRTGVAVAGTHGKTTTSSMIAVAARRLGMDPSYAIGGELVDGGGNAASGSGDLFVAEADESDGSFLRYRPRVSVITNIEPDHLDHYGDAAAVDAAFAAFARLPGADGLLAACTDDPGVQRLLAALPDDGPRVIGYGEAEGAQVRVTEVAVDATGTRATVHGLGPARQLRLRIPGRHHALNAAAALVVLTEAGADPEAAIEALGTVGGAHRRFDPVGEADGVRVVDDYAHHPTEVAALLRAARDVAGAGRVVAVFQPHLVSRTRAFATEFGAALSLADVVVLMDVYVAREEPDPGVRADFLRPHVALPAASVLALDDAADVAPAVVEVARAGDLVLTIGAGDVTAQGPAILQALRRRVQA